MKKLSYYGKTGRFVERERRRKSRSGRDFWGKFKAVFPFKVRVVQTDNGSEFLGKFAREFWRE